MATRQGGRLSSRVPATTPTAAPLANACSRALFTSRIDWVIRPIGAIIEQWGWPSAPDVPERQVC
eukprot:2824976-Pleurochrysis_carterae.AAC.1